MRRPRVLLAVLVLVACLGCLDGLWAHVRASPPVALCPNVDRVVAARNPWRLGSPRDTSALAVPKGCE